MKYFEKLSPEWALRLSLGIMYLYSGLEIMFRPTAWYWAIPGWLKQVIVSVVDLNVYLTIQGAGEVVFALVFLAWFVKPVIVKYVALLSTLEFAAILALAFLPWSETNFLITFRDIGLLGASAALLLIKSKEKAENLNSKT